MTYKDIIFDIEKLKNNEKSIVLKRFFKTGKDQYGYGDKFLGITVPEIRKIAKKYVDIDFKNIENIIVNEYHEIRLTALLILTYKFEKNKNEQEKIFNFYLKYKKFINNWDLVDLSCYKIIGEFLLHNDRNILYELSKSKNLWEKRISIVSTYAFIRNNEYKDTFKICEILMDDEHDLIHKACGWMLREVGKRINEKTLCNFLDKNYKKMPRTMLRYSIERLNKTKKEFYLKK